jgi:hypothetical protein
VAEVDRLRAALASAEQPARTLEPDAVQRIVGHVKELLASPAPTCQGKGVQSVLYGLLGWIERERLAGSSPEGRGSATP